MFSGGGCDENSEDEKIEISYQREKIVCICSH